MAGLLDVFNSPEGRLGLGLLSAGMPSNVPQGQRLAQVMQMQDQFAQAQQQAKQQALQAQYVQSQIDENKTQNRQREMQMQNAMQQQARENSFFGMGGAQPTTQGAGMMPQSAMSSAAPQPAQQAQGGMPTEGKFDEWSRTLGIPKDALVVDYMKNGGKGIAEMIAKRGTPDMQVTNGYAYDKNKLGAGFMPFLSTSQDGKSSMGVIGPNGMPVVMAPQGAMDTFAGYQGAQASFKPIKVYNPQTGREEYTNEGAVVRGNAAPQPQYSGSGYAGGSAQAAAPEQLQIMQSELNRLPQGHPDRPAIMREMQRLGGGQQMQQPAPQSGNYAAGPSAQEAAMNDAAKTRAVNTAAADVVRDTGRQSENKLAGKLTTGVDRALELLNAGPTASVIGGLADKGMGAFGVSTKSGETAAQLDALSGWLTSNVPRMEGPQSNIDVQNYQTMAGRIGDRNLPIGTRKAAAEEVKRLQSKYAELNGGNTAEQPAKQSSGSQREFSMLPNASEYNGKRMRAPDGTIYRSSGGRWNKE